jgi:hypothetical protein
MTTTDTAAAAFMLYALAEVSRRLDAPRRQPDRRRLLALRRRLRAELALHEGVLLTLARGAAPAMGIETGAARA